MEPFLAPGPSLTKAKDEAADLWTRHSADYDKAWAVQTPSVSGHGHTVGRKRVNYDTDAEYQRDLRRKRSQAKQNKAHKMAMTAGVQDMDKDFRYVLDLPSGGLIRTNLILEKKKQNKTKQNKTKKYSFFQNYFISKESRCIVAFYNKVFIEIR